MRIFLKYTAVLVCVAILTAALVACYGGDDTSDDNTDDTPVVSQPTSPYAVKGIENAATVTGVNCQYALLTRVSDLEAVAGKDASQIMYPASMTKVMTFIVAYENAKSLEDKTAISKEMKNKYAEASRVGIDVGDILTTEQLLYAMLLESDTDAALALAQYVAGGEDEFVKLMNAKCDELGLVNTHFSNVTGLHNKDHYTTAAEMTAIFAYALKTELFRKIITTEKYVTYLEYYKDGVLTEYRMTFQNTVISPVKGRFALNNTSLSFNNGTIIGGKTGFTDEAKYCLALLVQGNDGEDYILITAKSPNAKNNVADSLYICENYLILLTPTEEKVYD